MKELIKATVIMLDWLSCVIQNVFLVHDVEPPTNPIEYGLSVLSGLVVCACCAFAMFIIVGMFICVVASYPITSGSIALVLGLFIGIGYWRKKIGGKLG